MDRFKDITTEDDFHAEVRDWMYKNIDAQYHNISLCEVPRYVFSDEQKIEVDFMLSFDVSKIEKQYSLDNQFNNPLEQLDDLMPKN